MRSVQTTDCRTGTNGMTPRYNKRKAVWRIPAPAGWCPTEVNIDCRYVDWEEIGSTQLKEPFFSHTLSRIRHENGGRKAIRTDVEALRQSWRDASGIVPAGVIFHISRCGSTLITNYLKAATDAVILSEPDPFMDLLLPGVEPTSAGEVLRALVRSFAHHRSDTPHEVVLKLSPVNDFSMLQARAVWPTTPFLIVLRDPADVVTSNIVRRAPWLRTRGSWKPERKLFPWAPLSAHQMNDIDYCARAVGDFCDALRNGMDNNCKIINYHELNVTGLEEIARWFGLVTNISYESMCQVMSGYSKSNSFTEWRVGTRNEDAALASAVEGSVQIWASAAYRRLQQVI